MESSRSVELADRVFVALIEPLNYSEQPVQASRVAAAAERPQEASLPRQLSAFNKA